MLDIAIRKSGAAISHVSFLLVLSVIASLGLVWLSVALTELLASVVPTPMAPAITGGLLLGLAALAYSISRWSRSEAKTEPPVQSDGKSDELVARATRLAERMAPESPVMALAVAVAAGWASVSIPASLGPLLNKLMDDAEKAPGRHFNN